MQLVNLQKNISEIFKNRYVVPLYQRNYAWGSEEVYQLLQDIYASYRSNPDGNYYIGTLVVLKRRNNDLEVIDGQQRLTTLSLIAKVLSRKSIKEPILFYDSRPEVESFLNSFYQTGEISETTDNHLISHFIDAVGYIESANLDPKEEKPTLLSTLPIEEYNNFKNYFFNNVILVLVEIPQDTDVAHYFEVMNNRGEQLEQHEVLKGKLLDDLKDNKEANNIFSIIWDACSQMNISIQRAIPSQYREQFFGVNYDEYSFNINDYRKNDFYNENKNDDKDGDDGLSIREILDDKVLSEEQFTVVKDKKEKSESIIDFSNFLLHVLKLYTKQDVSLNGDDLKAEFSKHEVEPLHFIERLLFYKVVFDRFILRALDDENSEENYKWILRKPEKYYYEKRNQIRVSYKQSFDNQDEIIKCLSMLQVTFRTKKYKNWLQMVLSWFSNNQDLNITEQRYLRRLHQLSLNLFEQGSYYDKFEVTDDMYAEGVSTPHYIFNFLDYLLWLENPNQFNFEFKYRNSIEHHLPQSFRENAHLNIDNFGNLCLLSKGANSRMNNESPIGKASREGKYYKETLPPKQKIMYDITNSANAWNKEQIVNHYDEMKNVINDRAKILNIQTS